ncbi:hypothetical protein ABZ686_18005 [Streptomyces sp. NPDC006992]|uniref:hypothetical protein n=1 Tax=Streptomyces sp. NPDC006992 TaxID=3155601 RepID=UPI0033C52AD4
MLARFSNPQTKDPKITQGTDALKEGREYTVLEVFVPHGKDPLFRVEFSESEDPALFDSRAFKVTSSHLPTTWRYFHFDTGSFALRPEPWSIPGFWEAYYDRSPWAVEVYEAEKRKILASSHRD